MIPSSPAGLVSAGEEDLGYDVLLVPDHLDMPAPFPALVAAAEITSQPRLGTLVLNTGFYKPALLARDVASTVQLVEGRPAELDD